MINLVDSHAHIYLEAFKEDREEIMNRATEEEVNRIYMPNIDHTTIDDMFEVEEKFPTQTYSMMGLHPCSVQKDFEQELYLVEEWLGKRAFAAVGEIGTDLYWDKSYWGQQQEAFKIQIGLAKKHNLPVVIHCRESIDETIEMVEELYDENLSAVFHCFTGNQEQAERILKLDNVYLGLGGVTTFKNGGMDKVVPHLPLERLLLETDSPYLTPTPHRGKRNEPAYISIIAKKVASLKEEDYAKVADVTTINAERLFNQYK